MAANYVSVTASIGLQELWRDLLQRNKKGLGCVRTSRLVRMASEAIAYFLATLGRPRRVRTLPGSVTVLIHEEMGGWDG